MRSRSGNGAALAVVTLLAGCGGGGGAVSTPAPPTVSPTPTAAPTPTPTPVSTPAATFDTVEYRRSDGPSLHNAISAWQVGATGRGVTIGIVDSGIDTTNPEFAGRISAASADVAGDRGLTPESSHGTQVALIAAAARDSAGILGIAWQATILALRADTPGSCATTVSGSREDGCTFNSTAIAAGVNRATQNGAKVINLSLGGSSPGFSVRDAISRAAASDVVVVVAAGNEGDAANPEFDPASPDPFAAGIRAAGNGNVIIAGSVDDTGQISAFSNRAGAEANSVLMALGDRVCCQYENGIIKTEVRNGQQIVFVGSGTSFSAPQIAGAVALLRQAFPNLSAAQTVDLLLRTARDAGAAGTDPIYGRGILDIGRAFAPQGSTTLAGTSTALAVGTQTGTVSPAMGDAGQSKALSAMVLDSYGRAYRLNLGAPSVLAAAPRLGSALIARTHEINGGTRDVALAFSVNGMRPAVPMRLAQSDASNARVLAARMIAQVSPAMRLGFAYAQNADGLVAALQDRARPAFLLAGSPLTDSGFVRNGEIALALRRDLGGWGLTVSAENGRISDRIASRPSQDPRMLGKTRSFGARLDRGFGAFDLAFGATWLAESRTVLGAQFNTALTGAGGSDTAFFDVDAAWHISPQWRLGAALRRGWSAPRGGGLLAAGSRLESQGWSIDLARSGLFASDDTFALRLAQPLRVMSGGLNFALPTAYSYDTMAATSSIEHLSLAPNGRELIGEMAWRGHLWGGSASASLFYRKQPGHFATIPAEQGAALSWSGRF